MPIPPMPTPNVLVLAKKLFRVEGDIVAGPGADADAARPAVAVPASRGAPGAEESGLWPALSDESSAAKAPRSR